MLARCVLLVGAVTLATAQSPQIEAVGPNIVLTADVVTINQNDGQSITSTEILAMQSALATATSEIARLSGLVTTLMGQVVNASAAAANANRAAVRAIAQSQSLDTKLQALPIDPSSGSLNLIKNADLSNTTGWTANTVVVDRVQFSGTGGLPVPINAHRVDEVVHDDALTCYGRFPETNYVKVDPMKSYKVGIWIKSTGRDMKNYFGFRIFTEAQVLISDDTDWVNPYFKDSRSDANIWNYHTGILRPADTANTNTQHGSGETTSAFDWKMSANTSYVILRFGACYGDGDGQDTSWFAYPSMRQVFPREDNVEDVQPKDPTQSTNLINFADFSDRRSWIQGNFDLERTPWNAGRTTVAANAFYETVHTDTSTCYSSADFRGGREGFAKTNYIKVDPSQKYDLSIWIKSNATDMNNYVGFLVYDANFVRLQGAWNNPYFRTNEADKPFFVYHNFKLWPSGTDDSSPDTERYFFAHDDTSGNLDWILPSQAAYVVMRWGSCYGDGDGTGASFFVYPSVGLSFGDKLAGLAINTPATAVRSLGGYTIQAHTVNERPGTAGVDPSPWNDLHDGLGFDLTPYSDQLTADDTQEVVARMCASYSDDASSGGTMLRLRRISRGSYGNAPPYTAGQVFWQGLFPRTWSGADLQHHRCGGWFVLDDQMCGFSWLDTCTIDYRTTVGAARFVISSLNIEFGVRRRA